jgi:hypothetical protein
LIEGHQESAIHIPGSSLFGIAFTYDPRQGVVAQHSLEIDLAVRDISINPEQFLLCINTLKKDRDIAKHAPARPRAPSIRLPSLRASPRNLEELTPGGSLSPLLSPASPLLGAISVRILCIHSVSGGVNSTFQNTLYSQRQPCMKLKDAKKQVSYLLSSHYVRSRLY